MSRKRARLAAIGVGLALAGLGTTVAFASIPDSEGVIHGCYSAGGSLRVIDFPSQQCLVTETPLSWNSEGPAGPQGAQGLQGLAGADGEDGQDGAIGPQGPAGPEGPEGPEGPAGAMGPAGPDGPEGAIGPAGPEGPEGPVGPEGPAGVAGPQGPQGATGPSDAFTDSTAAAVRLRRSQTTLGQLDLTAGPHVLLAKVALSHGARRATRVRCLLVTPISMDRSWVRLRGVSGLTVHLLASVELAAPSEAVLRCRHYSPSRTRVRAADVQLTAVRVETLTLQ